MIHKVSKQDDSGVVEDEMKSIHSPYSTQFIAPTPLILYQPKTQKSIYQYTC